MKNFKILICFVNEYRTYPYIHKVQYFHEILDPMYEIFISCPSEQLESFCLDLKFQKILYFMNIVVSSLVDKRNILIFLNSSLSRYFRQFILGDHFPKIIQKNFDFISVCLSQQY